MRRIVATRKSSDQVVLVVSATGDSTGQLMDLADGPGDYCIMEQLRHMTADLAIPDDGAAEAASSRRMAGREVQPAT